MKKIIIISVLVLLISNLFCYTNFACIFTQINPSATDIAFGLDSGTANIWNRNPLDVWSNPAKLGYYKGFSFSYSKDKWFDKIGGINDMYHNSSYLSFGWNGIGILLPALSAKSRWGTVMSYGEQDATDEEGNLTTVESFEVCSQFALGINTLEFVSNFIYNENVRSLQYYGDLSVGFNYDIIHSELAPESYGQTESQQHTGNAHSTSIGLIGRISPFNKVNVSEKFYRLDLVAGVYFLNPGRSKITYKNYSLKDPLPWGTRSAFSGKLSFDMKLIQALADDDIISLFCKNIFSIYYSQDNALYGKKQDDFNPRIWGEGVELTFFDIFSYRKGQYVDRAGVVVGNTEGYGLNLSYKDIIQFQYNKVKFPGGELQKEQKKTDYMFRIDFLKAYELVR